MGVCAKKGTERIKGEKHSELESKGAFNILKRVGNSQDFIMHTLER